MLAGDILRLETPGGGGYGSPIDRPPELVLQDVKRGYYDRKTAEEEYGVLIVANDEAVDTEGTAQLRASLRVQG